MPKIADEFKSERTTPSLETTAMKNARPVAKPAPMAPRNVSPKGAPTQQSALADKLRAQREAAEKLATQRVNAARERAESRIATEPKLSTPPQGGRPASTAGGKPKFSFADETPPPAFQPSKTSNGLPPLMPPRPALGGDRAPSFSARNASFAPQNGSFRQEPPAGFRPIDPATGYPTRQPPGPGSRGYPPLGTGATPALPAGRRQAPPPGYDERHYGGEEEYPSDPRLSRSMARHQPVADDGDDVFDEPAPAPANRRRASAAEYNAAYREAEEGYAEPTRRSGGPWLLLFALLLAAVATGGIVWYYQTKVKPVAATGTGTTTETVPVVAAPEDPAKTAAETPPEQMTAVEPTNKKQIYDRIVGDQEVLGGAQLSPTEQTPIQPEPQATGQDAQTGSELIPAPAGTIGTDDAEPLPLPPPPGEDGSNTQGNLNTQVQPASTESASNEVGSESIGSLVQKSATDTSAALGTPEAGNTGTAPAEPVPQLESIGQEPAEPEMKPADVKKPAAETKKVATKKPTKAKAKPKAEEDLATGEEPVVLVPPSQGGETASAEVIDIGGGSTTSQEGAVTGDTGTAAAPKKKKTIFDLFKKDANAGDTASPTQQETQVASNTVPEDEPVTATKKQQPAKQTATKTTGGTGYVAQLASFRSQSEAQAEFGRLQGKYPDVLGGQQANITTATVAGSTRYRLAVGPMASREAAQKVCGSLLASGERDCLVSKR